MMFVYCTSAVTCSSKAVTRRRLQSWWRMSWRQRRVWRHFRSVSVSRGLPTSQQHVQYVIN